MHDQTGSNRLATHRVEYVPAVDGLRFFAVGSVLLFHLWRQILPGGFVGVDVFFVISGYLITGVLTRPDGAPTLLQFYQNRIARIAPASLATIITTLIAGYLLYDEQTFAYLGSAATSAAVSLINIKLLFQSTYFAASAETQPLLHFWSLAVEEQFYLFYPAALILLRPLGLRRAIAVLGLASFALCLVLTWRMPTWAFYLLPTRAWELFAGGWLALRARPPLQTGWGGWIGFGLLLLSFVLVSDGHPFPGWQALVPVVATMLMLDATRTPGRFSSFLSAKPLTWVGLRSYSLYLWHWPVYSFTDYALGRDAWIARLPVKLALTLILALTSYELVEKPLRKRLRSSASRRTAFASFIAVVAAVCATGTMIRNTYYLSAEGRALDRGGFTFNEVGKPRVVVIGDSEAAMYGTVLRDTARRRGWRLRLLGAAGTNELPGEAGSRWPTVSAWLKQDHPDVVVIAYAWNPKLTSGKPLDETLSFLDRMRTRTILLLQPPQPAGSNNGAFQPISDQRLNAPEDDRSGRIVSDALVREIASHHRAEVIDPAPLFLGNGGAVKVRFPGEPSLYYDKNHLSRKGAENIEPAIDKYINNL